MERSWHWARCSNQRLRSADKLAKSGLDVAVINPRFIKPLDEALLHKVFHECRFVLTLEEGQLMGGFGSAVLELANERGWDTRHVKRLGLPDLFVEHGGARSCWTTIT